MKEAERRGLPCLFKLRHTEKVKTLVSQMQRAGAAWEDTGQGWEVLEATLALERLEFGPPCGLVRERMSQKRCKVLLTWAIASASAALFSCCKLTLTLRWF